MGGKQSKGTSEQNLNPGTKGSEANLPKENKVSSAKNKSTPDTAERLDIELFKGLPDALIKDIGGEWLTRREAVPAEQAARVHHGKKLQREQRPQTTLFKAILTETEAAYAVLTGSPERLLRILAKESRDATDANKTSLFFKKCVQITDPSGQVFHNVSPAELIDIVCDDDMQRQVAEFAQTLPQERCQRFLSDWKEQRALRGCGGADLLKVTKDPIIMPFDELLNITQAYTAFGEQLSATYPLLQNRNGLIYYKDDTNQVHWYYVEKEARTVRKIQVDESRANDVYNRFKSSMDNMEAMSARRSSNEEHQLISTLMRDAENKKKPIQLEREGYQYVRNEIPLSRILSTLNSSEFIQLKSQLGESAQGLIKLATENDYQEKFFSHVELCALQEKWPEGLEALRDKLLIPTATQVSYCDIQLDFNRYYNAYRQCIRLWNSNNRNDWIKAANIWEKELGSIQKEAMWLLQRYCEENRPFYGMPDNYKELPFIRSLKFAKYKNDRWQLFDIYDRATGCFDAEFGSNFAIYRDGVRAWAGGPAIACVRFALLAGVRRHVEDAKANVVEFRPDASLPPTPQSMLS